MRLLALATLLMGASLACTNMDKRAYEPSADSIKIGMINYLSLPAATVPRENAALLACQEINEAGGVMGHKLDMLITGDFSTPVLLNGTQQLLDADVVAIVGGATSTMTLSMASLTTNRVPILAPSATSPALSALPSAGSWVFHIPPSDAFQGQLLASKALSMGIASMGVIFINDTFGSNFATSFKKAYEANGGQILSFVPAPGSASGYGTQVTTLFGSGVPAGVLIIATTDLDGAIITRDIQVADPQPKPTYFGCDAMNTSTFLANAAPVIRDGMYGTTPGSPSDVNYTTFQDHYIQCIGYVPSNVYVACTYDAVYLIAYAMVAGQAATPQTVSQKLRDVSGGIAPKGTPIYVNEFAKGTAILASGGRIDYQGASGKIDFNATGDPTSGIYNWWQIQNGVVKILETIPFSGD